MKRVLVTGASGFIGRNLAESYLAERYELSTPRHSELDLLDADSMRSYLRENNFDAVIHTAIKPTHRAAADREQTLNPNLRMFMNIARNKDWFGKLIVTGSGSVYDSRFYEPKMAEEHFDSHVPIDDLGLYKYIVSKLIHEEPSFVELRIFGIYGKYEDYRIRFISNMICKALFDLPLTMKQDRFFDYILIDDLVPVVEHFIENEAPFRAYNVTPDRSESLVEIAKKILGLTGRSLPMQIASEGLGLEYSGDNSRLRSEIPALRFVPLEEGIGKLIDYYRGAIETIDRSSLLVDR